MVSRQNKEEKVVLRYSSTPPYFTYSACTPLYSVCTPLVLHCTPLVLHLYSTRTPQYSAVLRYTPLYSVVLHCTPSVLHCTPLVLHPYSGVLESRLFPLETKSYLVFNRHRYSTKYLVIYTSSQKSKFFSIENLDKNMIH